MNPEIDMFIGLTFATSILLSWSKYLKPNSCVATTQSQPAGGGPARPATRESSCQSGHGLCGGL